MNDLTFAHPAWFWALLLLLVPLALRLWSQWRAGRPLSGLVSPRLRSRLVGRGSELRRWTVFSLQMLALAATVATLARPRLGFEEVETETRARNLILAVDTSRSMLADDLSPNRLSRAKFAAKEIVRSLPGDRIGVIAFAGRPFLQAPLTVDHGAVLESIDQLDSEIIPRGGTNLAAAAELALETFGEAELEQSTLVVFSDGEALEGTDRLDAIRARATDENMAVIAVGVATEEGSVIPRLDQSGEPVPGEFVEDEEGNVVRSRLDPAALRSLASEGGIYVHLGGRASVSRVVDQLRRSIATSREEGDTRRRPIERFAWPLTFAILCLALSHFAPLLLTVKSRSRRTIPAAGPVSPAILIASLAFAAPAPAAAGDALEAGHEAFEKKDYQAAIEAYEDALPEASEHHHPRLHMGIGAAAFRRGDYERAIAAYGWALSDEDERLREHAHYNLGNTLYRRGEAALSPRPQKPDPDQPRQAIPRDAAIDVTIRQWKSAVEHYESTLALNGDNERASHNLRVVKKRIEELEKRREEQRKNKKQEEKQQKKQDQKKQDEQQKKKDGQNQDGRGQEQEKKQRKKNDEEKSDREQQDQEQNQDSKSDSSSKDDPSQSGEQNGDSEREKKKEDGKRKSDEKDEKEKQQKRDEGEKDDTRGERDRPDPADAPPPEKQRAPSDGELEADSNPAHPQQTNAGEATPRRLQPDPETGYSPSQARRLLEALADETEVRPLLKPARNEDYKDW